ncbi:putative ABC transport system permease protein [Larkinella arboricola]|uniref:Putative ABC transport system permease protein n=1 Tax=Larkinella arboricola TaxID=643671 RepID=A0A327X9A6_LARAB|nr:ABC transporter permease [Larkinella arboricola]RAK02838.1 putative ABC transport system permease protein [Larkinella arboricola]
MLRNYIKIAIRNLRKQRGFTFINIFGLAVGLACCLLITLYVIDELRYDRYHEKANRIYRVNSDIKFGGNDMHMAVSPDPMGPTLLKDYSQVENFVRLHGRGTWLVKRAGQLNSLRERDIIFADSTLFDVFTLPLVAGNPKRALVEPNTVVISESAAKRQFGNQNPMGQSLVFDNQLTCRVTGVMRDMPTNSHFRTDYFISMRSDNYEWGRWLSNNHHTYVLLKEGVDYRTFNQNFETIIQKYVGPQVVTFLGIAIKQLRQSGNRISYSLIPMTDIHLRSKQTIELAPNSDIQYVYVFSAVAVFILLIACINFMNLSTARSANRAKEVGVRKVLGSVQRQLIGQFMTESILMSILAMGLALVIVALTVPFFNQISAKQLTIDSLFVPQFLPVLLILPLVVGLLAGSYPAFFLSSFRPISVLKGKVNLGLKSAGLRSGLVVFQFMMSVILIIGTMVVYRQINFIQTTKLGFKRDQVLTINEAYALDKQAQAFKEEILKLPGVVSGSLSSYLPVPSDRSDSPLFPEGQIDQAKAVSSQLWAVDHDYIPTLGMEMAQGRNFSREFGADSSAIILNETAVKIFGFKDPIGQRVARMLDDEGTVFKTYTVIGVVKNFHFESLRQNIGSVAFFMDPSRGAVSFRISSQDIPALVKQVEAKWRQMAPGMPFNYSFLEDSFDSMYRAEQRVGQIVLTFSVLAILIACLGLFGLAAFMAEQRTKEIGVRKVLGASATSIVGLLSKDFLKLVLIAILIATPIAWYGMNQWLEDFAYKIDVPWWVFAVAGVVAVVIAFVTVSFQSIKAALTNPVKSLRAE